MDIEQTQFAYRVTEEHSESLIDAFMYLLLSADSTSYLYHHLEADNLPTPITKLLETIKKSHGVRGDSASLADLDFPLDCMNNPDKASSSQKSTLDISKVLSNVMKYIEYHFETAEFRLEDSKETPEIEDALTRLLETSPDFEDKDLATLIRFLYLDLIPTPGGKTSLSLEEQLQKIKEKHTLIRSDFQQTTKFTKTKLFLLREMNRKFLLHFNQEFSDQFESIIASALKRQQQKLLELNPREQLSKLNSRYDQMIIDHRFERFDLINQVSTGLIDIKTNFILETKTFDIRWVAFIKNSFGIYTFKFKTVSHCEIANSLTKYKARYPCCSVKQMMATYLENNQRGEEVHKIDINDFDYLAVYFDPKTAMYRFIPEDSTFVDAETSITIFNENTKTINNSSTIRVLFSTFYRQSIASSEKVTFLFLDANRDKTVKDLLLFAKETIDPDINPDFLPKKISDHIWFALNVDFKTSDQIQKAEQTSKSFNFQLDTPVSEVVQAFWKDTSRQTDSDHFIDLVCFKSQFTAEGQSSKMQTKHYQHNMSDLVVTRMLTVESVLTYLFRIGEERNLKATGEDEKNKLKNYDVTFFLPNQLFVDVRTVTTKIEHSEDMDLTFLKERVEEEHRHLIESSYRVKGGIMRVSEGIQGNKQQYFRPFVIERLKNKPSCFKMITPKLTPEVLFNIDAHSTNICYLFYERSTNN